MTAVSVGLHSENPLFFGFNRLFHMRLIIYNSRFRIISDNASVIVPEMEDLYEDMCDGACICAVIAFYRPNDLNLRGSF